MTIRFVVFNGPPESGKSTAAPYLVTHLRNKGLTVIQDSFANPMKHFIATTLSQQYYQIKKDEPSAVLRGDTVREFLIGLSEDYIKRRYGDDFFGRTLYHRALRHVPPPDFVVVDDSGFSGEFDALGESRARFLVRVSRPGKDFSHDSRGYLADPDWYLNNDGSIDDLRGNAYALSNILLLIHKGQLNVEQKRD